MSALTFFTLWFMLLAAFVALGFGVGSHDFLVYKEYTEYHSSWLSDGGPSGFIWKPSKVETEAIPGQSKNTAWQWFWQQPLWMHDDRDAKRLLLVYRLTFPVGASLGSLYFVLFMASRFH